MPGAGGHTEGDAGSRGEQFSADLREMIFRIERENIAIKFEWPPLGGCFYVIPRKRAKEFSSKKVIWFTGAEIARIVQGGVNDEKSLLAVMRLKRTFNGYVDGVEQPKPVTEAERKVTKTVTQEELEPKRVAHEKSAL